MTEQTPYQNWRLDTDKQGIVWLGLDGPGSANMLSRQIIGELDKVLDRLHAKIPRGLVLYSCKPSGFVFGADINEFPDIQNQTAATELVMTGQRVLDRLEALRCPSVAVLNGTALGGGLELAMACDWRLAFAGDKPVLGLPEVQLGLQPGLGGTVRAPELIGVRAAMELLLSGKPVRPSKALATGLVDDLTDSDHWRQKAAQLAGRTRTRRDAPMLDRILSLPLVRPLVAGQLRKQVARKARREHYPAPYAMIDLWQRHGAARDAFRAEAQSFARLLFTPTSRNLVRIFFLQNRLKGLAKASERQFTHVHVVGAGTMGADIAAWCAIKGLSVTLQDREKHYVDAGLEKARQGMQRKFKGDEARTAETMARLVGDHTGEGARSADLIIEAIFEDKDAKQKLFSELEQRARPDALLASNTSSIPLEQIAAGLQQPQRLVGLHFFNPVARMPLVEIVAGSNTGAAEADAGAAFAKRIGKLPLPCKGLPGFLVNRILAPYMDEAFRLYEEGCQPEAIDKLAVDFGMPVGPLELADSVGLDILMHVGNIVGSTIGREPSAGIAKMVADQRLGEKSGQGFYSWKSGKPDKQQASGELPENASDRLMLSLVNEAAACLAEGVVADADLCDAGSIFGSGFAPFRGGPLQYARSEGISNIVARLAQLEDTCGNRFKASTGWQQLQDKETPH